ncbi:MAG: HDIG domain-containing protein [Treponema sp.]|nr:HDIG domain-containing protein [Candidatus Treponema caballi]
MTKKTMNREGSGIKKAAAAYLSDNKKPLLVFTGFFILLLISLFFNVTAAETVLSFNVYDYEPGQISDITVTAERDVFNTDNTIAVEKGEKVIRKGFPITEQSFCKLKMLAEAPDYFDSRAYLNSIVYFLLLSLLAFFLYSPRFLGRECRLRELIFLCASFLIIYCLTCVCQRTASFSSPYMLPVIIPATFFAILITVLFGQLSAVYFSFITFFAVLEAASFQLVPALFMLCSCILAIRIVRNIKKRFDLVVAALALAGINALLMGILFIIFSEPGVPVVGSLTGVAFNGFISSILALGFLTPLESMLNTASVFRLMDLSDLNSPIMRKLLITAPGTYNHSMMVATLAENACTEIGANPLLARVGAYYHDLGKMDSPEYFVENQSGDNKHDEINNPRLSVSVIRSHVKKGVEKAHQLHLPDEVIDIIAEHHGNSLISYFYNEALKLDDQTSPEEYSYIGTPPASREAAVVMLADTVEAACRTLERPSVSRLEKFIHTLVMAKYEHRQLDRSNLTFKDLNVIEAAFVQVLAASYHSRIEYPDQKDPDEAEAPKSEEKAEEGKKNE